LDKKTKIEGGDTPEGERGKQERGHKSQKTQQLGRFLASCGDKRHSPAAKVKAMGTGLTKLSEPKGSNRKAWPYWLGAGRRKVVLLNIEKSGREAVKGNAHVMNSKKVRSQNGGSVSSRRETAVRKENYEWVELQNGFFEGGESRVSSSKNSIRLQWLTVRGGVITLK